jgi:hypothetical protein
MWTKSTEGSEGSKSTKGDTYTQKKHGKLEKHKEENGTEGKK